MKLVRSVHIQPGWFAVVPLANVLFLLCTFIWLSSAFVLQPGVTVSLPTSPFSLRPERDPLIVSIVAGPKPAVWVRDRKTSVETCAEALAELRDRGGTVVLRADRGVPYGHVASVMNRALALGFEVILAGEERKEAPEP